MKLIYCITCADIVRLKREQKKCDCGESWGQYLDDIKVKIGGKCIPLGLDNNQFKQALMNYDSPINLEREFDTWIIGETNRVDQREVDHEYIKKKINQKFGKELDKIRRIIAYSYNGVF